MQTHTHVYMYVYKQIWLCVVHSAQACSAARIATDLAADVWESESSFQAFGKTLLPIMKDLESDPGAPQASPVHNIIKG